MAHAGALQMALHQWPRQGFSPLLCPAMAARRALAANGRKSRRPVSPVVHEEVGRLTAPRSPLAERTLVRIPQLQSLQGQPPERRPDAITSTVAGDVDRVAPGMAKGMEGNR